MDEDLTIYNAIEKYQKKLAEELSKSPSKGDINKYRKDINKRAKRLTNGYKAVIKKSVKELLGNERIPRNVMEVLRKAGAVYEFGNVEYTTYTQIITALAVGVSGLEKKINNYIKEAEQQGEVRTIANVKSYIQTTLEMEGLKVTYKNGSEMPLNKYAMMVARTTRIETDNIAMLGKAIEKGNDLVECSVEPSTCPLCAVYQGRIYSISGNNKSYPALYKTAFRNGYSVIHPNCRHQFFPYDPRFHSEEENKELEKGTHRSWEEDTDNRHFQQTKQASDMYARSQMQMRKWNNELNEYKDYREYCLDNNIEPKYKSLGGFRRAYRAGNTEANNWRK